MLCLLFLCDRNIHFESSNIEQLLLIYFSEHIIITLFENIFSSLDNRKIQSHP